MHIEASFQRIAIDVTKYEAGLFTQPGSLVFQFLNGDFSLSADRLTVPNIPELAAAVTIAHEQRHYLDQCLTNHGSLLVRFWSQMKSAVPAMLDSMVRLPVPIRFAADATLAFEFSRIASEEPDIHMAARLAARHNRLLTQDYYSEASEMSGFSGGAQLEALATAFESGVVEDAYDFGVWVSVSNAIPRSLDHWTRGYVWPRALFDQLGLGLNPDLGYPVAYTRLWPAVLVASLMGEYHLFTRARTESDPHILDHILPSRRFARIMNWLAERPQLPTEPLDLWAEVNQACVELFGVTVPNAMLRDLDHFEAKVRETVSGNEIGLTQAELLSHLRIRRRLHDVLTSNPLSLIDPPTYWEQRSTTWPRMAADWFLYRPDGFDVIPPEHGRFESDLFRADTDGRPQFLKPNLPTEFARTLAFHDEVNTLVARYFVCGRASDSWVGSELTRVEERIAQAVDLARIPPFA